MPVTRDELIAILLRPAKHRVEENGRGGYRCKAGDFEVDWTSADRTRISEHCASFVADAILEADRPSPSPDLSPDRACICGHPASYHRFAIGCSGSHADSEPCLTYTRGYAHPEDASDSSVNDSLTR